LGHYGFGADEPMTITLRSDQQKLKADIYNGWNTGRRNMLAVLPTGGGKSVIVADIVFDKNLLGAQQTVIAHRNELIEVSNIE
jgi:superfamily II DNA or RNA helicase